MAEDACTAGCDAKTLILLTQHFYCHLEKVEAVFLNFRYPVSLHRIRRETTLEHIAAMYSFTALVCHKLNSPTNDIGYDEFS